MGGLGVRRLSLPNEPLLAYRRGAAASVDVGRFAHGWLGSLPFALAPSLVGAFSVAWHSVVSKARTTLEQEELTRGYRPLPTPFVTLLPSTAHPKSGPAANDDVAAVHDEKSAAR